MLIRFHFRHSHRSSLVLSPDVSPASSDDFLGSSRSPVIEMWYVIKDGVRELDQRCNKLLKYGEVISSVKQEGRPKAEDGVVQEEQQKEYKEGVKVDRVGEAFVVEISCPCGRNYRTLFSGRDCYLKIL